MKASHLLYEWFLTDFKIYSGVYVWGAGTAWDLKVVYSIHGSPTYSLILRRKRLDLSHLSKKILSCFLQGEK